jgi:hypothetical protein
MVGFGRRAANGTEVTSYGTKVLYEGLAYKLLQAMLLSGRA